MNDEIHGEYPPDVESQMVTEATQGKLSGALIEEVMQKMQDNFLAPDDPSFNLPDKYKRSYAMSPMMGQPAIYVSQGHKTDPRVILTSGGKQFLVERMVDGMIQVAEAMALAIEVFDHPTKVQVMQARRALEHAVKTLEGAEIT